MSGFQSLWIQEFSLFEGRFLPFACTDPFCVCCGGGWSSTTCLQQQGLASPRRWLSCPVLGGPGGTTGTLLWVWAQLSSLGTPSVVAALVWGGGEHHAMLVAVQDHSAGTWGCHLFACATRESHLYLALAVPGECGCSCG